LSHAEEHLQRESKLDWDFSWNQCYKTYSSFLLNYYNRSGAISLALKY